jgi:hypothetical protein
MLNRVTLKLVAILGKMELGMWQVGTAVMLLPLFLVVVGSSSVSAERGGQIFPGTRLAGIKLLPQFLAQKERRTALVIGNGAYGAEGTLTNPPNDAVDIATALKALGFDEVRLLQNVNQQQMEDAINQFARQLRQGGVGVFYYAGHGSQSGGENYLIPVGDKITREQELRYKAVPLGLVTGGMEDAGNKVNIVILDACRNNPYIQLWNRSGVRGLAAVRQPEGMLVAFATAPGAVAADGEARNSPYTAGLLKYLREPELPVELMFKKVRETVSDKTGGRQYPQYVSSLSGNFAFNSGKSAPPLSSRSAPLLPSSNIPDSTIARSSPPSVVEPTTPGSPSVNPPRTALVQSNEGILFQLKGCRSESSTIKCTFLVIDQAESRQLIIYGRRKSKIIDPQGNEYLVERVRFGSGAANGSVTQNLAQGIGLTALISFENVPNQVNQLALVEVSAYTQRQGPFTVQFRDVPVSN